MNDFELNPKYIDSLDINNDHIKADVYWNLHKNCWSVRSKLKSGRRVVVGHLSDLWMTDVQFVVSEAGRQRVLRERKKNVHAFARGLIPIQVYPLSRTVLVRTNDANIVTTSPRMIGYNPYHYESFVKGDGISCHHNPEPVDTAKYVTMWNTGEVVSWEVVNEAA